MSEALDCPACTAAGLRFDGDAQFVCEYCGVTLVAERTECPACGFFNAGGIERCSNCAEPLSIVAGILDRQGHLGPPLWIRRLRGQVRGLKASAAAASEVRMAELIEIDRRRLESEYIARVEQERKDRAILFYGSLGVLVFLLLVALIYALSTVTR